jgi:hypothetical protein
MTNAHIYARMSESDLLVAARSYDAVHNEGGEGYNPYRDEIAQRSNRARAEKPRTKGDVLHELMLIDNAVARECGTYDADRVAALQAEYNVLASAEEASALGRFVAEWTRSVTIERRARWNSNMRQAIKEGRKVNLAAEQKASGHTLAALQQAIAMHKLPPEAV